MPHLGSLAVEAEGACRVFLAIDILVHDVAGKTVHGLCIAFKNHLLQSGDGFLVVCVCHVLVNLHTAVAKCVAVAYGISGTGVSVARQLK